MIPYAVQNRCETTPLSAWPLPHIPTLRGWYFFCLQVWVHAGLWGVVRTAETGVRGGKSEGFVSGGG